MKQQVRRGIALGTLSVMLSTALGVWRVQPVRASSKGRRNTALALGAITAYGLLSKKKKLAIAGAVGTAIAYRQYSIAKKRNSRNARRRSVRRARLWNRDRYNYSRYEAPRYRRTASDDYYDGSRRDWSRPEWSRREHVPRGNAYGYWKNKEKHGHGRGHKK
jgi:hypothetical protein